jgi:allantoinase
MKFAIKSKRVLINDELKAASLLIEDGKITDIVECNFEFGFHTEDFGESVIMPALTDTHVHINEPGRTEWEGFETATKAAAAGGITTLVDMPLNSSPVTTDTEKLHLKIDSAKNKLYVDAGFYGGLIPENINELNSLIQNGVVGLKAFMVDSGLDEFPFVNETDIRKAFEKLKDHRNVPVLFHAEIDCGFEKPDDYSGDSFNSFLKTRPENWENQAVELLIKLCREYNQRIHIVHLSSGESVEMIRAAKKEGLPLTVETCPHYLYFSSDVIPDNDTRFKCTPPIRNNENREKLWEAVKEGVIDFIVSDHSPCDPELKFLKDCNFEKAWGGISGLQFGLSVIWTAAKERGFSVADVSKLMSRNTAEFIGIGNRKGKIQIGFDADLIVFDPEKKFIVEEKNIFHKHKVTPYSGKELYGVIETTFLSGIKVYENGKIVSEPVGKLILNK